MLWSPDGFFDCSEGAESLIGWHVNRGKDRETEFFPASRLYDYYYRPDIVKRVLAERRPASEIAKELGLSMNIESALKQTPQLALKGATDGETIGTDTLQLTLEAQDTGGGLRDIALFHNGKRIPADGPSSHGARGNLPLQTLRFTVTLMNGENTLRAQAANDKQTIGTPSDLKVNFSGGAGHEHAAPAHHRPEPLPEPALQPDLLRRRCRCDRRGLRPPGDRPFRFRENPHPAR